MIVLNNGIILSLFILPKNNSLSFNNNLNNIEA